MEDSEAATTTPTRTTPTNSELKNLDESEIEDMSDTELAEIGKHEYSYLR